MIIENSQAKLKAHVMAPVVCLWHSVVTTRLPCSCVTVAKWLAHLTAKKEVSQLFEPSILPLLKHACGESNWLLCWQQSQGTYIMYV